MKIKRIKFDDIVYYDESSPSYLRWKVDRMCGKKLTIVNALAHSSAGGKNFRGYWSIKIDNINYLVHRVIWQLLVGEIPENYQIDHLDGNRLNNNISNLRAVERTFNYRNSKKRKDNTSGVVGVCRGSSQKTDYWVAHWVKLDGKRAAKYFSIKRFGEDAGKQMAIEYRLKMMEKLNLNGAGYTDRHINGLPI